MVHRGTMFVAGFIHWEIERECINMSLDLIGAASQTLTLQEEDFP